MIELVDAAQIERDGAAAYRHGIAAALNPYVSTCSHIPAQRMEAEWQKAQAWWRGWDTAAPLDERRP